MKSINETLETKVRYETDVLVAGGGFAGIAAALSAARQGAKVILIERGFILGGLGTAGLVTIYLPICDGEGRQVSFGLAEELLRLSIEHGADGRYPELWMKEASVAERAEGKRFEVQFNPSLFAISAERVLRDAGVRILYGTTAVAVSESDSRIDAVIIESKSGREAISVGKCVVDATGDADICHLSSAVTKEYSKGNTLAAWYYSADGKEKFNDLKMLGFADAVFRQDIALNGNRYRGLDAEEISDMTIDSHRAIEQDLLERRERGEVGLIPTSIATIPQLRMTRCLVGLRDASASDDHKELSDSVGLYPNWRKRGPVYELSAKSLYGGEVKNLLAAGRCLSVEDDFWDITRVIPVCSVSGEAAGVMAAMTDDLSTLDLDALQAELRKRGVKLHLSEVN